MDNMICLCITCFRNELHFTVQYNSLSITYGYLIVSPSFVVSRLSSSVIPMANRVQIPTNNSALIAMIADEVRVWQCLTCFLVVFIAEQQLHACSWYMPFRIFSTILKFHFAKVEIITEAINFDMYNSLPLLQ